MKADYLVTGGAGFIGSHIVRALAGGGAHVRVLDNLSTGHRANIEGLDEKVELLEADLRSDASLAEAVQGVRAVFHLAALPSVIRSVKDPLASHDVNATGTLKLFLAARDAGVERVVFTSSSSVYGNTEKLPKREDMLPMPLSPYALSKLAGEHYGRMFYELYGLKTFSLRYFNVFGPRQDPKSDYAAVIPLFMDAYRAGKQPTIFGDGGQTRDFTYVDNVVAGNLACLDAPDTAAGGVYNLACGDRISVKELASQLASTMGAPFDPVYAPPREGDVRDSQADSTRAREELGWEPLVTFEDGLARTVEWFLAQR